jgi:hypothetical protein
MGHVGGSAATRRSKERRAARWLVLALVLSAALRPLAPAMAQGALSAIESDTDLLARRARASVVTVIAQRTASEPARAGSGPTNRQHRRAGSGVAVEPNGILTTASVVLGAEAHPGAHRQRPACGGGARRH